MANEQLLLTVPSSEAAGSLRSPVALSMERRSLAPAVEFVFVGWMTHFDR
jgi:hypothetical protein